MKKFIAIMIIGALALALASCAGGSAEAFDYSAYIPDTAQIVETERDDGFTETEYRDADGSEYSLYTDNSGAVRALKYDSSQDSTATEATLTAEEAFAFITAVYPNARLLMANAERDDGRCEWVVLFADGGVIGEYELDAATGAILEYVLFYGVAEDVDPVGVISASYAGAEILNLDLGHDDGRLVYEGEARLDGGVYEFAVDADSGKLVEWEKDDG